jgi:DivIVA domain-containing protein
MIDLTPLDIRKKKGDFGRGLRGYDPQEVDTFLEMAADRLEELVRDNLMLKERTERLAAQVQGQEGREKAVQEALVTAQALRGEIQDQAKREAELSRREAENVAHGLRREAEEELKEAREEVARILEEGRRELGELNRARNRFLRAYRTLLERELDVVEIEESNPPAAALEIESEAPAPAAGTEPHESNGDGEWKEDG